MVASQRGRGEYELRNPSIFGTEPLTTSPCFFIGGLPTQNEHMRLPRVFHLS
jgi:hypothetical protein